MPYRTCHRCWRSRFAAWLSFLALFFAGGAGAAEAFRVGVAPHTSARVVIAQYQPLRAALAAALAQPVELVTARDFTAFARNALAGQYDLAITTAHQAALLRDDAGFVPLLTYQADFEALAVVAGDGDIKQPHDLHGRKVLGLSPASLVTLWGQDWLDRQKIRPESTEYVTASDSVAELVRRGEAAVGFVSLANLQKLAAEVRDDLRILARSGPIPGRVYLLSAGGASQERRVRDALANFADSSAGRDYFAGNQLGGYRPIRASELDAQRVYAAAVRRQLRDLP